MPQIELKEGDAAYKTEYPAWRALFDIYSHPSGPFIGDEMKDPLRIKYAWALKNCFLNHRIIKGSDSPYKEGISNFIYFYVMLLPEVENQSLHNRIHIRGP